MLDPNAHPNPSSPHAGDVRPAADLLAPQTAPAADDAVDQEPADQLDAANASLAGALAVSFTVLRWVMILLIVVFLFSGFFTVRSDEVAVRTRFGRIIPDENGEVLTSDGGPYFRWPAPIGQVYRIPTTPRQLRITDSFVFASAREGVSTRPLSEMSDPGGIDPEIDGALLTGDQAIVHARYNVQYRIEPADAAEFVRNVASVANLETEEDKTVIFARADQIVRNAVEQAIVEDVAATPLDRFLRGGRSGARTAAAPAAAEGEDGETPAEGAAVDPQAPVEQPAGGADDAEQPAGDEPAQATGAGGEAAQPADAGEQPAGAAAEGGQAAPEEEDQIRVNAQRILDEMDSGITIVTVARTEQAVLSSVRSSMAQVRRVSEMAQAEINAAETQRNNELIAAAGPAYEAVLALIDVYEEADRLRETSPELYEQARTALRDAFRGEPLGEVIGRLAQALPADSPRRPGLEAMARQHATSRLGGRASTIVDSAASQATAYVTELEADANRFEQQLKSYRERPDLVKRSLLAESLRTVLSATDAETTFVSPGTELRLQLNRDREAAREEEAAGREAIGRGAGN